MLTLYDCELMIGGDLTVMGRWPMVALLKFGETATLSPGNGIN